MGGALEIKLEKCILSLGIDVHYLRYELNAYILLCHLESNGIVLQESDSIHTYDWLNAIDTMLYCDIKILTIKDKPLTNTDLVTYTSDYLKAFIFRNIPDSTWSYTLKGKTLTSQYVEPLFATFFEAHILRLKDLLGAKLKAIKRMRLLSQDNQEVKSLLKETCYGQWRLEKFSKEKRVYFEVEIDEQWYRFLELGIQQNAHCDVMVKKNMTTGITFRVIDRISHKIKIERTWKEESLWSLIQKT